MSNKVVVTKGLKAGERIIVEGTQKAPLGSVVKPVPFDEAAASAVQPKTN